MVSQGYQMCHPFARVPYRTPDFECCLWHLASGTSAERRPPFCQNMRWQVSNWSICRLSVKWLGEPAFAKLIQQDMAVLVAIAFPDKILCRHPEMVQPMANPHRSLSIENLNSLLNLIHRLRNNEISMKTKDRGLCQITAYTLCLQAPATVCGRVPSAFGP